MNPKCFTFHKAKFVPQFQCYVRAVTYDRATRTGHVFMDEGSCTDMPGTIEFFASRGLDVDTIATWQGERPDTAYAKDKSGEWHAYVYGGPRQ